MAFKPVFSAKVKVKCKRLSGYFYMRKSINQPGFFCNSWIGVLLGHYRQNHKQADKAQQQAGRTRLVNVLEPVVIVEASNRRCFPSLTTGFDRPLGSRTVDKKITRFTPWTPMARP